MVGGFSESQHVQPTVSSDVIDSQRDFYHADVYAIHQQQEITKKNIQK
jgi:predicted Rdx family selenoprotein